MFNTAESESRESLVIKSAEHHMIYHEEPVSRNISRCLHFDLTGMSLLLFSQCFFNYPTKQHHDLSQRRHCFGFPVMNQSISVV
jgi:hypothetical protein